MYSSVDTIWVLLGAALVFFMQAGFAMVEAGFTRAKNAGYRQHLRHNQFGGGCCHSNDVIKVRTGEEGYDALQDD